MSPFLEAFGEYARSRLPGILRVSESYRGGAIETAELRPAAFCQDVYSVAKTFTMTALGLLYDRGLFRPEDRLCGVLRDELPPEGMDPRWHGVTADLLLRHRAGLSDGFLDIDASPSSAFTADFLRFTLLTPFACEPGTEYHYSDGAYYLLARMAEKLAGKPLDSFLWETLLLPLGFQEMAWSHCPQGHVIGATGLYAHASDVVKLGLLYLDGGLYRGQRLLSREWTELAAERGYALDRICGGRMFGKGGMYNQFLYVVPEQGRVVAIQSFDEGRAPLDRWILDYGDRP